MADTDRLVVSLEVDCSSDPPRGRVIGADGEARHFESLLGLLSALQAATDETREDRKE